MTRAHVDRAGLPVCGCGHQTRLAGEQHRQKSRREQRVVSITPRPRRSAVKAKPKAVPILGRSKREAELIAEGKPPFKSAIWFGESWGWGVKRSKTAKITGTFSLGTDARMPTAAYLQATGKAAVPTHDPAFGRRAA
jgi:hypothetical protein